jgi:hypothetical protein
MINTNNTISNEIHENIAENSLLVLNHDIFFRDKFTIYDIENEKIELHLGPDYNFEDIDILSTEISGKHCYHAIKFNKDFVKISVDYHAYGDFISAAVLNELNQKTEFAILPGVEGDGGTYEVGNKNTGGYLVRSRNYIDDDGDSVAEYSGIRLNKNYPQKYDEKIVLNKDTGEMDVHKSYRVIVELHNDGLYVSKSLDSYNWIKIADNNSLNSAVESLKDYTDEAVAAIENEQYKGKITLESTLPQNGNINGDSYGIVNCDITAPNFSGIGKWNGLLQHWDIYPDKTLVIDGNTLVYRDSDDAVKIADFNEINVTIDTNDYGTTIQGDFKTIISGLFKKIRGLHSLVSGKVDKNGTNRLITEAEGTKLTGIESGAQVNPDFASQQEAEAGTDNTKIMTSLRVAQATADLQPAIPSGTNKILLAPSFTGANPATLDLSLFKKFDRSERSIPNGGDYTRLLDFLISPISTKGTYIYTPDWNYTDLPDNTKDEWAFIDIINVSAKQVWFTLRPTSSAFSFFYFGTVKNDLSGITWQRVLIDKRSATSSAIVLDDLPSNNYNQGIRINRGSALWSGILLGGKKGTTENVDPVGVDSVNALTATTGNSTWWIAADPGGNLELTMIADTNGGEYGLILKRNKSAFLFDSAYPLNRPVILNAANLGIPATDAAANMFFIPNGTSVNTLILTRINNHVTLNGYLSVKGAFTGNVNNTFGLSIPNGWLPKSDVKAHIMFTPALNRVVAGSIDVQACTAYLPCPSPAASPTATTSVMFRCPTITAGYFSEVFFDTSWDV